MKIANVLLFSFCVGVLFSCKEEGKPSLSIGSISIEVTPFGHFGNQIINEYILTNQNGVQVGVINYGGAISRLIVPDKDGNLEDIVTGFTSLDGFLQTNNPYFGALIGRYANRIGNASFSLNGREYRLESNDNANSLHGGRKGFDKVYWDVTIPVGDSSLLLTYTSPDGEEGYPGNLQVEVMYTLTASNALKIKYKAMSDQSTPINLTSHAYFNLSAWKENNILSHELTINSRFYTPVNQYLIPTGEILPVDGTPMDFRQSKSIGKEISQVEGGFDHNWVLDKEIGELVWAAILYEKGSGRQMEVWTDAPGIQFYSGNFLDGTLNYTKNNLTYHKHSALCLETQHFPDSPNHPEFPSTLLHPGQEYRHTCIYKFSTR
ncbi:MAG TPA: aldose epimerase family protein [Saprospiraceae bacterium]|nr:aldose epimerase family protein [Saprospiraceae bacterium]